MPSRTIPQAAKYAVYAAMMGFTIGARVNPRSVAFKRGVPTEQSGIQFKLGGVLLFETSLGWKVVELDENDFSHLPSPTGISMYAQLFVALHAVAHCLHRRNPADFPTPIEWGTPG